MPQVSEIVEGLLEAATDSTDRQELKRLKRHVEAVKILKDQELSDVARLEKLLEVGYLPDYYHAAETTVSGSVSATVTRKSDVTAGGEVAAGPVRVIGNLKKGTETTEASNVQFTIRMERLLISDMAVRMLAAAEALG